MGKKDIKILAGIIIGFSSVYMYIYLVYMIIKLKGL